MESLHSDVIESSARLRRKDSSSPQLRAKQERERVDVAKAATEQRLARVLMQKRQATYRDTLADYKELMVQFGYVTQYSPVFPLAAAFAWLNNTIESRSDLLKLVNRHAYQRPIAQHARVLPSWTHLHRFALIVACEHVIVIIKAWLNWAVPEVPVTSSLGEKSGPQPANHEIPARAGDDTSLGTVHGNN
ncbi:unnamed protein product [Phytophthora fragariaefolia]|uniref:Unnamed protein product n=1 Tax=Phytophthora fragariaefolia TaxID=1490495 RepID=A0A9W6X3Z4_9STRA|nr:unnamed protein product [Phytophthora fragariaefolia]